MTLILCALGAFLYYTGRFSLGSVQTQGRHVRAAGAVLMLPAAGTFVLSLIIGLMFAGNRDLLLSMIGFLSFIELVSLVLASIVAYILIADPAGAPRLPGILGIIQAERRAGGDQPARPPRNRTVTINPRGFPVSVAPVRAPQKQFGSVLTTKEAAEYMNVTEAEILQWIDTGKLAAARINYMYRIAKSNLDDLRAAPPVG